MTPLSEVRLLSFNVRRDSADDGPNRWRRRRDLVAAIVRGADVAGLQEVRPHMLRDLDFGVPHHRFVGVGRGDGGRRGEHVPVFWRAERFRLLDHGHFWLSSTPEVPGSKDHPRAIVRMATWARLTERQAPHPFVVLNTHLDHRVEDARVEGAQLIRERLDELVGPDEPVIVMGDLNETPAGPAYAVLTGDGHRVALADAHDRAAERSGPDTTLNGFQATRPGLRIDVVLLSPHWEVLRHAVDDRTVGGRYPSDHFPVHVLARRA